MFKYNLTLEGKTITFQITEVDERMRGMGEFNGSSGFQITSNLEPSLCKARNSRLFICGCYGRQRDNKHVSYRFKTIRQAKAYYEDCKEALTELSEKYPDLGWNDRVAEEEYWYFNDCYYWLKSREINHPADYNRHKNADYFPTSQFTEEQLIKDRVSEMSLLERKAYKYGCFVGDWMSEEDRLDYNKRGSYIYFDSGEKAFRRANIFSFYGDKWFSTETADDFCKIANTEGWDYRGR